MCELIQTSGSWLLFVVFIILMLHMHGGGMDDGPEGEHAPPSQTPLKDTAAGRSPKIERGQYSGRIQWLAQQ